MNATDQRSGQTSVKPTIVLGHGAFADASSWNGVMTAARAVVDARR